MAPKIETPVESHQWEAMAGELDEALVSLGPRDRRAVVLRYLEGLSNGETAAVLGLGEGAVGMRHLRALERLRILLGEDAGEGLQ